MNFSKPLHRTLVNSRTLICLAMLATAIGLHIPASLAQNAHRHQQHATNQDHKLMVSREHYHVPQLTFRTQDNQPVRFDSLVGEEPVIVNFIFTSCTAICPIQTATFAQLQNLLTRRHIKARFISISIDPETDTPSQLAAYAHKFHAAPNWLFLTGTKTDSISIQKAFNAFRGPKMNHIPLTLIKSTNDPRWLRIEGFASARDVANQLSMTLAR